MTVTPARLQDHELDLRRRTLDRLYDALERVESRPPRERPPRIEVIHRRLKAAIAMLELVGTHLDTLRDLAYDRSKAAERVRVRGGDPDYALDTNGDPRARELYQQAAWEILDLIEDGTVVAHDLVKWMSTGEQAPRRRTAVDASPEDIVIAIEAQDRRLARGEGTPPTEAQPKPKGPTQAELEQELSALRRAVAKLHGPRLTRADRNRLTTLEAKAWEKAVPKPSKAARTQMQRPGQRGAPYPERKPS